MSNKEQAISTIIKHIKRVEDNCNILARKIMPNDFMFALKLIQLGRIHDASKFDDFEFKYLGNFEKVKPPEFPEALKMHHSKNPHHPEYWKNGIHEMTDIYLAEMVCDCVARSQEQGSDPREWFTKVATEKYGFTMNDHCGQMINDFLNLLLTPAFK